MRDVHDAGDFICLVTEREKQCPGWRLPLSAGEFAALSQISRICKTKMLRNYKLLQQSVTLKRNHQYIGENIYSAFEKKKGGVANPP